MYRLFRIFGGLALGVSALAGCAASSDLFREPFRYATGPRPITLAAGDFNGDGKTDVAVSDYGGGGTVRLLYGRGDGEFTEGPSFPTGSPPAFLAVADLNGDQRADLALAHYGVREMTVYLSSETGFRQTTLQSTSEPMGIAFGDFNGDGKNDLLVASYGSHNEAVDPRNGSVSWLAGRGDGTFEAARMVARGDHPYQIVAGDWNGDGKADFAYTEEVWSAVVVGLGAGDGTFKVLPRALVGFDGPTLQVNIPMEPSYLRFPVTIATGDLNGDGKLDLAVGHSGVGVLLGRGDGTFEEIVHYPSGSGGSVAVADWNGDGKLDVACGGRVLLGRGDGTLQGAQRYQFGAYGAWAVAAGDWNGDGRADLAVANVGSNNVSVFVRKAGGAAPGTDEERARPAGATDGEGKSEGETK